MSDKKEFKFEIGELLLHVTEKYKTMCVVSRYFEEFEHGLEEKYLCSYMDCGHFQRHVFMPCELNSLTKTD